MYFEDSDFAAYHFYQILLISNYMMEKTIEIASEDSQTAFRKETLQKEKSINRVQSNVK